MGVRAPVRITEPAINVLQRSTTDRDADAGSRRARIVGPLSPGRTSYPSVTGGASWPVASRLYGR